MIEKYIKNNAEKFAWLGCDLKHAIWFTYHRQSQILWGLTLKMDTYFSRKYDS